MEDMRPKAAGQQLPGDSWGRWDRSWQGASQLGPGRALLGEVVCALEQLGSGPPQPQVGMGGIPDWPQTRGEVRAGDSLGGEVLIAGPCFLALFPTGPSVAHGWRKPGFPCPL